jgi:hypothetical protein
MGDAFINGEQSALLRYLAHKLHEKPTLTARNLSQKPEKAYSDLSNVEKKCVCGDCIAEDPAV